MEIKIEEFVFESVSKYNISMRKIENRDNVLVVCIKVDFGEKIIPEPTVIGWKFSCKNVFSQWNARPWTERYLNPNWLPICNNSRSADGIPIQSHISVDGKNVITVSVNDPMTPMQISSGIIEETAEISYKLTLFTEKISPVNEYETELRISKKPVDYTEAISEAANLFNTNNGYLSPDAREPMYSSWYSFHQNIDHDELLKELTIAKEMGMKAVIVDDGWQTDDSARGYAYCGDWQAIKIKDMKKLVSDVHKIGMKFILWYSVPFVGIYSSAWKRFEGRFLNSFNENHPWCVLDPRYPDVREYLISTYEDAMKNWDLDGFKLDFIDEMRLTEHSNPFTEGMDCESLEEAIEMLLFEIQQRLSKIKPDVLIEFRQPYIGPIMCKYGNMLRVADCPLDAIKNRQGIVDLRLTSKNVAIHSDMLMWNYDDTPQSAAIQFISIIFGVPQISVLLKNLSDEHKSMLKFYLDFWKNNKECLISGKMTALNPDAGYSLVYTQTQDTIIAVAYIKNILNIEKEYEKIVFINGSWDSELYINNKFKGREVEARIYNCKGEVVKSMKMSMLVGINAFEVPPSGMVELKAI